jgi:hypothetical protein
MKEWRLNFGYRRTQGARLALAGTVASACALVAFPAPASANFFLCTAQEAAIFPGSRIHVLCNPGDGAIAFFALSVANPDTSRVFSLVETAVAARRPLGITYDPNDLSGAAIGCINSNCRLIQAIGLERQ